MPKSKELTGFWFRVLLYYVDRIGSFGHFIQRALNDGTELKFQFVDF